MEKLMGEQRGQKKAAVILSGCGYLDGAEIRESVAVLYALDRYEVEVQCYAPDIEQHHVVDHRTMQESPERRNVLREAARIARGKIKPLDELNPSEIDLLVMPGGFGVAKNLTDFASKGAEASILPELKSILSAAVDHNVPIAAACISPAALALALPNLGLEMTFGAEGAEADQLRKLGHNHVAHKTDEIHIDSQHKIVTTSAYMDDNAAISDVFAGIETMIAEAAAMADINAKDHTAESLMATKG